LAEGVGERARVCALQEPDAVEFATRLRFGRGRRGNETQEEENRKPHDVGDQLIGRGGARWRR
jgi:hypothetical protein